MRYVWALLCFAATVAICVEEWLFYRREKFKPTEGAMKLRVDGSSTVCGRVADATLHEEMAAWQAAGAQALALTDSIIEGTMQATVQTLNADWLDGEAVPATVEMTVTNGDTIGFVQTECTQLNGTTWTQPYYNSNGLGYYWYSALSKIRLTLTEVQKLRAAAKKDATVKEILRKFTAHIEIEVDFP